MSSLFSRFALIAIGFTAAPALADDSHSVPPRIAFPTMGPDGLGSSLGGQVGIQVGDDAIGYRFDLSSQFVNPEGYGGYAAIGGVSFDEESSMSNLDLGGLYRITRGNADVTLRAGLALPTAHEDGAVFVSTLSARPSDLATGIPDATSLRVAAAPTYREGALILRGDLGLDRILGGDDLGDIMVGHFDVGVGFVAQGFAMIGELQSAKVFDSEALTHVCALTAQLSTGEVTPYLTLSKPFGDVWADTSFTNAFFGIRSAL